MQQDVLEEIQDNIEVCNQDKAATHFIGEYAVMEHLGSGGFGSVYKVKKKAAGQSYLAMKEVGEIWTNIFVFLKQIVLLVMFTSHS